MENNKKDLNKLYDEYIAEGIEHIRGFINSYNYEDEDNKEKRIYAIEKLTALVEVFAEVKTLIIDYMMDDELMGDSYPDEHNLRGFTEHEVFHLIGKMLCGMDIIKRDMDITERASEENLKRAMYTSIGDLDETVESIIGTSDDDDDEYENDEDDVIKFLGVDHGSLDATTFIQGIIQPMLPIGIDASDFINNILPYQKKMSDTPNKTKDNNGSDDPYNFTARVEETKIECKLTDDEIEKLCIEERSEEEQSLIDEVNEEATDDFLKDLFKKKGSDR